MDFALNVPEEIRVWKAKEIRIIMPLRCFVPLLEESTRLSRRDIPTIPCNYVASSSMGSETSVSEE